MNAPLLHILICSNERPPGSPLPSCGRQGSPQLVEAFRQAIDQAGLTRVVKLTTTGCLTPCQCGPNVVVYPMGTWYAGVRPEDVDEILTTHIEGTGVVERLLLPEGVSIL